MIKKAISADSHITEPPGTYVDRIDHKFKDRAPHMVRHEKMGDVFIVDGQDRPVAMGLIAAARVPPADLRPIPPPDVGCGSRAV